MTVSIHASVKDATELHVNYYLLRKVSIHASVKDATYFSLFHPIRCRSFNPRICKRCDKMEDHDDLKIQVSIHASVKDATIC